MSEINFVTADAQTINEQLVKDFEAVLGTVLYPGDERRIFLQQQTQVLVALWNAINDTGRQNLLRYARGAVLDALGERTDTIRLPAQKAKATLRFTLSSAQPNQVIVPAGTRVTPDGALYFATVEHLTIPAGQTAGDVTVEAAAGGTQYNGFAAGQIQTIVDPIPYVASVVNIDESAGGSDEEPDDDGVNIWSGYRGRIRESASKYSSAGPVDAYIYWAKTADVNIQDVAVTSPAAGEVVITVLMKDGELPSQAVLDAVLATCSDKKRRPLTDHVTAAAPTSVEYDITLTYYIDESRAAEEAAIRTAVEGGGGAVEQYQAWQGSKLGRAINPDYLRQLIFNAGANRVDVTDPVYTELEPDEVATIGTVNVTYGGLL